METPVTVIPTTPPAAPLPRRPAIKRKRRRRRGPLPPAALYLLGFLALVAVVLLGQLLLHSLQTEPRDAMALTEREIRLTVLRPRERVLAQVPVSQRSPLNYFRATRGVLMLTDQRLVYLGLVPRDLLASPDAPPAFEQRDFPIDTLTTVRKTRVFFQLQRGLDIEAPNGGVRLGASSRDWPRAQALQRSLAWQHAGLFAEGRRRREQQRLIAAAQQAGAAEAKRPRYHIVQRGEALASIARLYETTPERLQALNRITGTRIRIGDRIQVGPQ